MPRFSVVVFLFVGLFGCRAASPFRCDREGATCSPPNVCTEGFCAVPAGKCSSGLRFTDTAQHPGTCVAERLVSDAGTDVVTWHAGGARIAVHPGDCGGGLGRHGELPTFLATHVALADTNGDGRLDLFVTHDPGASRAGYFTVWRNTSSP